MRLRPINVFTLALLLAGGTDAQVSAQDTSPESAETAPEVLAAEDLGISLARIQRRLDKLPEGQEAQRLLRLNFYIQVYAKAPRLELFNGFDLHNSPIPYGVPTHTDMLRMMNPNPLYPPAVNLNPLLGWTRRALQP